MYKVKENKVNINVTNEIKAKNQSIPRFRNINVRNNINNNNECNASPLPKETFMSVTGWYVS